MPPRRKVDYAQNPHVKLSLEDARYRYHFTDSKAKPEIAKGHELILCAQKSDIALILRQCRGWNGSRMRMSSGALGKDSGINIRSPESALENLTARFRWCYVIKERKISAPDLSLRKDVVRDDPTAPFSDNDAWIGIRLRDEDGNPVRNERFQLSKRDRIIVSGRTDRDGGAKVIGLDQGMYDVCFPDIDENEWLRYPAFREK